MLEERSFFFEGVKGPLYGVLYAPENAGAAAPAGGPRRGVVVCDSLFEEKLWCERVCANLARHLASEGSTVLLFDYHGYGNSPGESEEVDVDSLDGDVRDACDLLRGMGCTDVALIGIRWGAALAERAARSRDDVDALFLVQPLTLWRRAFLQALRVNIAEQSAMFKTVTMTRDEILKELKEGSECVRFGYRMNHIEGYIFSRRFHEQSEGIALPGPLPATVKSVAIFDVQEGEGQEDHELGELASAYRAAAVSSEVVPVSGDNRFWINNRTFTSLAPNLNREIGSRVSALGAAEGSGKREPARSPRTFDSIVNEGVRETAISFRAAKGSTLLGILYEHEAGGSRDLGIICNHGGLIGMNGAFRFNTRAARQFAQEGITTLCFDPHGMGRSVAKIGNIDQRVLFRKIQAGLFADDTEVAVAVFRERTGIPRVALFGVCGGAITNIIAHGRSRRIDASVLLSVPVMLSGLSHKEIHWSAGYARFYLSMYAGKIFNPKAWWRFLTFQSEYGPIFKAFRVSLSGALRRPLKRVVRAQASPAPAAPAGTGQPAAEKRSLSMTSAVTGSSNEFNFAYLDAYRAIISRGEKILLCFGGNDNIKWEFNAEFAEKYPADVKAGEGFVTTEIIPDANHMYSIREWQDEIVRRCMSWFAGSGLLGRS